MHMEVMKAAIIVIYEGLFKSLDAMEKNGRSLSISLDIFKDDLLSKHTLNREQRVRFQR